MSCVHRYDAIMQKVYTSTLIISIHQVAKYPTNTGTVVALYTLVT